MMQVKDTTDPKAVAQCLRDMACPRTKCSEVMQAAAGLLDPQSRFKNGELVADRDYVRIVKDRQLLWLDGDDSTSSLDLGDWRLATNKEIVDHLQKYPGVQAGCLCRLREHIKVEFGD